MSEELQNAEVEEKSTTTNPEAEAPEVKAEAGAVNGEDSPEDGKPKKHRFQKRINELTKQKGETARERDAARAEAEELRKQLAEAKVAANPKPDRQNYVDMDDFEEDLVKWSQENGKVTAQHQDEAPKDSPPTAEEMEYIDRLANTKDAAADKYTDFDEIVNSAPVLSFELAKEALDSELSDDILYYLGNNHDVAETLSGLNGAALTREVGKLEAKLEAGILSPTKASNTKPVSNAPDPIEPIGGGGSSGDKVDDELSTAEWMKRRTKQAHG